MVLLSGCFVSRMSPDAIIIIGPAYPLRLRRRRRSCWQEGNPTVKIMPDYDHDTDKFRPASDAQYEHCNTMNCGLRFSYKSG